ncbi:MAG: TilS substrate-binding domain-containing protein [Opitutales bacterium]
MNIRRLPPAVRHEGLRIWLKRCGGLRAGLPTLKHNLSQFDTAADKGGVSDRFRE